MANDDYSMENDPVIRNLEIATIVVSIISLLFSSSVVFILLYKYNQLVRGKTLISIILLNAVADSLVSLAYSFGYPSEDNDLCKFQGLLAETFEKVSWLTTDILIFNIYSIIVMRKILLDMKKTCIFIGITVTVLTFLPFFNDVGYGGSTEGIFRCSYYNYKDPSNYSPVAVWGLIQQTVAVSSLLFILLIILRILVYLYCDYKEDEKLRTANQMLLAKESWRTMILYPISLILCWLPSQLYAIIIELSPPSPLSNTRIYLSDALYMLAPMNGLLLSLIFYIKTSEAKKEWMSIFRNLISNESSDVEMRESTENTMVVRITESEF